MAKLRTLTPLVRTLDTRTTPLPPKQAEQVYRSAEFKAWREAVVRRAGSRCEAVDHGRRCTKAWPQHRMFADHIVELRDGGSLLDPANGMALCGAHHTLKTIAARASRMRG